MDANTKSTFQDVPVAAAKPVGPSWKLLVFWYWAPAILWMIVISVFSTSFFGSSNTHYFLKAVLKFLHIKWSYETEGMIHHTIRKLMHFITYAVLSALLFRAWRGPVWRKLWTAKWTMLALGLTVLTASADEYHQTLVPNRTGSYLDVILDSAGGLFVQLVIVFWLVGKRRNSVSSAKTKGGDKRRP